jgi:hypothetical protein
MKTHKVSRIKITRPDGRILYQTHQVVKQDGSIRQRNLPNLSQTKDWWLESYSQCAVRGIWEELQLRVKPERLKHICTYEETKPSPSTGELKTYVFADFELLLTESEANACVLVAQEEDCTTYFEWRY